MRIRRRPQGSLLQVQLALDPTTTSTAPQTPQNAARSRGGWLVGAGEEAGEAKRADLGQKSGVARRLALPQDDDDNVPVDVDCGGGSGVSMVGALRRGADDGHMRIGAANGGGGHGRTEERDRATCTTGGGGSGYQQQVAVAVNAVEQRVGPPSNGVLHPTAPAPTPSVAGKVDDEARKGAGSNGASSNKKRRGGAAPAVLLEGSRCSRVNGRGWRCSQPTLVGYSLCEHHLGKGRMRSAAAAAAAAARGRLGRTEHGAASRAAPAAGAPAPPHDAADGTSSARC
ncbi:hypothetical protein U9M48_029348 [Paspalum notatum var. saurae]|uniref:WRC domain-containing protein n=1 Tax=Paspalum notatum var. saurae TaxID=547442 RepID=A0AAQ3TYG0_PASNO